MIDTDINNFSGYVEPAAMVRDGSDQSTGHGCYQDNFSSPDNMVCMPPHVFVFCIFLSALVSSVLVASQHFHRALRQKLGHLLEWWRVQSPHSRGRRSFRQLDTEGPSFVEAAEAIDRATTAPVAPEKKVPPRYVRAFCGNEEHALERWKATLKWRKENAIDSILDEPQPFFHDIRKYFPSHMSGRSRGGHIVVYEKLSGVNMRALVREKGITVPMLLRHWIFVSEYQYRVLQPTDAAQQVTIVDMKGVKIHHLAGKVQEYTKAVARLARLHYVERCHKTYVVNAPSWFGLSFRVVSPFLSAKTRQKIRILGSDLSALQDEIDPQFLPVEYGGEMEVPVSESMDERKIRRLVDAVNATAKANAAAAKKGRRTSKRGDSGKGVGRTRSSSKKSRRRTSGGKVGSDAPAEGVQRSSSRRHGSSKNKTSIAELGAREARKSRQIPLSGDRSRTRTNDDAPGSAGKASSPIPDQRLESRRATREGTDNHGSRHTGRKTGSKGAHGVANGIANGIANGKCGGAVRVVREPAMSEWHWDRVGASYRVCVREEKVAAAKRADAKRERLKRATTPIEDQLRAVRRDLGVPIPTGEHDLSPKPPGAQLRVPNRLERGRVHCSTRGRTGAAGTHRESASPSAAVLRNGRRVGNGQVSLRTSTNTRGAWEGTVHKMLGTFWLWKGAAAAEQSRETWAR